MIEVRRTPGNEETLVQIILPEGSKIRKGRFAQSEVALQSGSKVVAAVIAFQGRDGKTQLHATIPDPKFLEYLASGTGPDVTQVTINSVRVPITSVRDAVHALTRCEDSKMRSWGIDPEAWRALQPPPRARYIDPRSEFTSDDYPKEAEALHIEGDAIMRLDVSTKGTVNACTQLNTGAYDGFGRAACRVLQSARFRPALNASGSSVAAPIVYDVVFRLPY